MHKAFYLGLALAFSALGLAAQIPTVTKAPAGADSIPIFILPETYVTAEMPTRAQIEAFRRRVDALEHLRNNVRYLLPLANQTSQVIKQIDDEMERNGTKKDHKLFMKRLEKEMFQRYDKQLRQLSVNQGRLLLKLIDRQTGHTAYELIKDYKNGRSAVLWQLVARFFGTNLKSQYDPEKEEVLELIVKQVEQEQNFSYFGGNR